MSMLHLDVSQFDGKASGKRLFILGLFTVILTAGFWSSSRYPQLEGKALMGGRSAISSLAFDPVMIPTADDGTGMRIVKATVNWYATNRKGMTFGLILAGTFLAMLVMLSFTSSRSIFVNTLAGMFIGTPLGVCANCVAPISKSLDDGGTRLETTLATQFSSPTLNVIVVTILFTLYPLPVAVLKMGLTLFLILGAVPFLVRFVFVEENQGREVGDMACSIAGAPLKESWPQAIKGTLFVWWKCFWFIIVTAVPFMLLAGILGALAIEWIPADTLASFDFTWWGAILLGLFGTFLPVPIAFDVILPSILMGAGLHLGYVMVLLFTLGPFSIYPFLLFWQSISLRVVTVSYATVAALGVVGGMMIHTYNLMERSQITGGLVTASVREVLEDTCADSGDPGCMDESWARVAALLPRFAADACESIADAETRATCEEAQEGRRLLRNSRVQVAEIGRCSEEGSESAREACLIRVTQSIAAYLRSSGVDGRDPMAAQDLTYADLAFSTCQEDDPTCAVPRALLRAHYFQDPELCRVTDDPALRDDCLSSVALMVAKRSRDIARCGDVDDRALCVASIPGPSPEERIAACRGLGDEDAVGRCERLVLHSGEVLDDPRACGVLSTPESRDRCTRARAQREMWTEASQPMLLERVARRVLFPDGGSNFDPEEVLAVFAVSSPEEYSDEAPIPVVAREHMTQGDIRVTFTDFFEPTTPAGADDATLFTSLVTDEVGIASPRNFLQANGTTGAGDYDGDGWIDIVQSDEEGLHLYRNLGGLRFVKAPLQYDPQYSFPYGIVGLVDVDNDGDLDLFQAWTFSFVFIMNDGGGFEDARVVPFEDLPGDNLIGAPFADLDKDGLLDLLLAFSEEYSPNLLYMNRGMTFERSDWYEDQLRGRSYGAMFTDVNSDGWTDLFIGNDFEKSDEVLLGTENGTMRRVGASSGVITGVSTFNMGYETADINNDLRLDVFSTEALMVEGVVPEDPCGTPDWPADFRAACVEFDQVYQEVVRGGAIERCQLLSDPAWRADCAFQKITRVARATRDVSLCDIFPEEPRYLRRGCLERAEPKPATSHPAHFEDDLPQFHRNALHVQRSDGTFAELSEEMGVAESFWAWNSRIHDYDNDGWQDIYVVNGRETDSGDFASDVTPSVFFKNMGGERFEDWAERYGLADLVQSRTYVAEDFDLDGDVDILTEGVRAPYRMYVNGTAGREGTHAIEIQVRDQRMNRFGIGTQISIHHAGGSQIREIKSNGGFRSHNAPIVHFGLGEVDGVDRIELRWTDGTTTVLEGPFPADRVYTIERLPAAAPRNPVATPEAAAEIVE